MFWRKKQTEKKSSTIDKLIMGAIVGGAIGSVVGAAMAPQSGKETRQMIKDKSKELIDQGKKIFANKEKEVKMPEKPKGLWQRLVGLISKEPQQSQELRRIPSEAEEILKDEKKAEKKEVNG